MDGKNLLIIHGGGPTAVINASLYGAVMAARESEKVSRVLAARGGTAGLLAEDFIDFADYSDAEIALLLQTPASAIGTSRTHIEPEEYEKMADICEKHGIAFVLFNGGNGSMDACGRLAAACEKRHIVACGIPKTVDNDIAVTDHAPGFGSAARYIASITKEIGEDVRSLPIHVSIIETMGRDAGWITAASALAREKAGDAPHLIYTPERPFDEEDFLKKVAALHEKLGGVVVVVSEGLHLADGKSIVPELFRVGRSVYFGDVSAYLAELVIKRLGIKARSEKPGLCSRTSMAHISDVDQSEAILVGRLAAKAALSGKTAVMVGLMREAGSAYSAKPCLIPVEQVMLHEKCLPDEFLTESGDDVTQAFIDWCRPLIGGALPPYFELKPN